MRAFITEVTSDPLKKPDLGFGTVPFTAFALVEALAAIPELGMTTGQRRSVIHTAYDVTHPGVAEGGAARNAYCMACDGVVPYDEAGALPERCPHCGAAIEGNARRYFNWVEIDQPAESDLRALLPWIAGALAVLSLLLFLAIRWLG